MTREIKANLWQSSGAAVRDSAAPFLSSLVHLAQDCRPAYRRAGCAPLSHVAVAVRRTTSCTPHRAGHDRLQAVQLRAQDGAPAAHLCALRGNPVCSDDGVCRGEPFQDVFLEAAPTLKHVVHPNKDAPLFGLEYERWSRCGWVPDENLLNVGGCGEIRSDASFSGT
ncbi:hypothetical protein EDB84DRAFT_1520496 [Lactarius hengduanensis]|nr:hypothetical protein EDB84DRAFT_1520496 [Lactarius hengduanensis]